MPPDKRIEELLDSVLDGSCTDDERGEFSRVLDENPDVLSELTREVFLHNLLVWNSEGASRAISVEVLSGELELEDLESESITRCNVASEETHSVSEKRLVPRRQFRRLGWGWALAATLLVLAAFLANNQISYRSSSARLAVARIVEGDNVVWAKNSTPLSGEDLVPGRLETESGDLTVEFRSGPVVRFQGPASLMIESDSLVYLDRGQATARVPKQHTGFTIKTPVVSVVEQGTEFGVAARTDGHTDVVVFDGEVRLQDNLNLENTSTLLSQGEAARVDRRGEMERIMQVGLTKQGNWWTSDYPTQVANVIKEVRDNIPPSDGSKYFCYQISCQGLQEDVFAYADAPHQLNGVDAEGLPQFLLGADYVKTFNDYRYLNDFEMVVLFEQPAELYVLFDDRVPPPKWLTDQFQDTGLNVGLDEGPWSADNIARRPDLPPFTNGVGPGVSIDNVLSVWHRRCSDLTPIRLGGVGPTSEARAMYSIAATPLDSNRIAARHDDLRHDSHQESLENVRQDTHDDSHVAWSDEIDPVEGLDAIARELGDTVSREVASSIDREIGLDALAWDAGDPAIREVIQID